MDDEQQKSEQLRHPISIAMLFYLVTLSAIAATCARYLVLSDIEKPTAGATVGLLLAGAFVGLIIGTVVAFQRPFYRWMSPLFGIMVGLLASPLLLIPIQNHWNIMLISFTGCWILIVFSLLVARFRYDTEISRRATD